MMADKCDRWLTKVEGSAHRGDYNQWGFRGGLINIVHPSMHHHYSRPAQARLTTPTLIWQPVTVLKTPSMSKPELLHHTHGHAMGGVTHFPTPRRACDIEGLL